ncbi:hypothetical protein BLS_007692 [Venturia inaequalis]|uniref:Uncharacterized protein n=1 Tax=Venturia inaequalis TaxID=5025 RepID=A0A8H3V7B3_VENIN|nr:hypothetical protein BLS_007692 [Venturia inaequalis]KAE9982461.1 hypothetical protein EG328_010851 [Venturia inaequalis]RDI76421.1 hypothetical protein Vi05172_g13611 [Venturia inaequalis]
MAAISTSEEVYKQELWQHNEYRSQYEKAKSTATFEAKEVDLESKDDETANSIHWQPGVKARFPWIGLIAILAMLTCIAFSVVILVTSDKKVSEQWPIVIKWKWISRKWKKTAQLTPSVALAVTNTVSNLALAIAIGQGVAITWWRKALKGSTVEDLHKSWSFSTSVLELLTAGRSFNLVALAALTAKMALVDNLLLQKAAGTMPSTYEQAGIKLRLPTWQQQLPSNYVGAFNADGTVGAFTTNFSYILHDYALNGAFIQADSFDMFEEFTSICTGTCFARVPGFGFSVKCTDDPVQPEYTIDQAVVGNYTRWLTDIKSANMTFLDTAGGNHSYLPYLLSFESTEDIANSPDSVTNSSTSGINLNVNWAVLAPSSGDPNDWAATTCKLTPKSRTCELRPAVLDYSVQITNKNEVTSDSFSQTGGYRYFNSNATNGVQLTQALTNYNLLENVTDSLATGQRIDWNITVAREFPHDPAYDANLRGFSSMLKSMFGGQVELSWLDGEGFVTTGFGSGSTLGTWWTPYMTLRPNNTMCVMNITDPTEYIIQELNNVAFRASLYYATSTWNDWRYADAPETPIGSQENQTQYYESAAYKAAYQKYQDRASDFLANQTATLPFIANVVGDQFSATLQYQTNLGFMFGAIFTMFFCVLCVLPSYWGFWELGRKVTLGPMEIASAFQAPVLDHPTVSRTGGEVNILLKEVGERRVRYGEIEGSGRLAVAEPAEVKKLTVPSAHWRPGRHSAS